MKKKDPDSVGRVRNKTNRSSISGKVNRKNNTKLDRKTNRKRVVTTKKGRDKRVDKRSKQIWIWLGIFVVIIIFLIIIYFVTPSITTDQKYVLSILVDIVHFLLQSLLSKK